MAMVLRFQNATAVAPKMADPAMRNAVDQDRRFGAASLGEVLAVFS